MELVIILFLVIAVVLFLAYKLGDDKSKDNVALAVVIGIIVFCVSLVLALMSILK